MFFLAINRAKPGVEPEAIGEIIPAHIAWVKNRIAEGTVIQTGKWGNFGGISIVKAESEEEARRILAQDPIVQSGLFSIEIGRFYPDVTTATYE
jgi:uncharacterized protein YciI